MGEGMLANITFTFPRHRLCKASTLPGELQLLVPSRRGSVVGFRRVYVHAYRDGLATVKKGGLAKILCGRLTERRCTGFVVASPTTAR